MPRFSHRVPGTLALCIAAVVGCNSAKHLAPTPTGSMTVTINDPDGTAASVVVTGPKSYTKTITATQTLTGLAVGTYIIVADSGVGPDSVVGFITDTGTVTGSPATVANAATSTVTVSYAMKNRVGGLWVANNGYPTIPELASNQLRRSGSPVPAETLATRVHGPAGLALDATGNMWESSYDRDSLLMYSPAARNAGGNTAPTTVIVSTAVTDAENLAFDAHGNLWVANCSGNLLEFTPAQLAAGGTQVPTITISGAALICPWSLAFDSSGNVWVADDNLNHILKYSAAQLTATGTPTPVDSIGANAGSLNETDGLAFDAAGNLWVSNDGQPTVVEYTPAQLAAGGAPAPNAIITLPLNTEPFGLAFDNRGTLWVSDDNSGVMYGLTHAQLAATGAPAPAVADSVTIGGRFEPEQPLFDPYATAVGVSAARVGHHVAPLGRARRASANHLRHLAR